MNQRLTEIPRDASMPLSLVLLIGSKVFYFEFEVFIDSLG